MTPNQQHNFRAALLYARGKSKAERARYYATLRGGPFAAILGLHLPVPFDPGEWNGVLMPDDRLEPIPQLPRGSMVDRINLHPGGFTFIDRSPPDIPDADRLAQRAVEGHKPVKV